MKTLFSTSILAAAFLAAAPAHAEPSANERIAKLEQELELLKRQLEVKEEVEKTNSEKYAKVEMNNKGAQITSADGAFQLKVRGSAQIDARNFLDNENKATNTNQYLVRSARPVLEAKFYDDFYSRLMIDFGQGNTRLLDAFVDYKPDTALNFRIGKFKAPLGLERWQPEQELLFVERGLASNLMSQRDIGGMIYGELIPQTLEYQLAVTNGAQDNADGNGDIDNSTDVTGRLFAYPFRNFDEVALQGLGVGAAASYGNRQGSAAAGGSDLGSYRTAGQSTFFGYGAGTFADGNIFRINPELYYSYGPLGILAEYTHETQEITNAGTTDTLTNKAYTAAATYVLTGEDAAFDGVKPAENFDWEKGSWGAFEVAGRIGGLEVDKDTFPTFSSLATNAQEANEWAVGLNWYLNTNLKFNFNYSETSFEGGAAGNADRPDEKVILSRAQFKF